MGLVPSGKLVTDGAPFVAAFQTMFGTAAWVGKAVALVAVISGIGALNGWTMVTAEMPFAAAKDGLFPKQFALVNRRQAPWFGIVVSTLVASVLMAYSYAGGTLGLKVFTYLVSLSVVTVAIPYFFSDAAQLAYLVSGRRIQSGARLARDLGIATTSLLFSLWVTAASGYQAVYQAVILILVGLPIYAFMKAARERAGLAPEPVEFHEVAEVVEGAEVVAAIEVPDTIETIDTPEVHKALA
jgi:APA family basic amino acid/polyamine antiporter